MPPTTDVVHAEHLDRDDELAPWRQRFVIDDPELVYLDGNSLGRLPRAAVPQLERAMTEAWGKRLIRSWNDGWMRAPQELGAQLARLLSARPEEVVVAETTTINQFKLAAAALAARPARPRILSDELNFPSDLYVLEGLVRLLDRGHRLELVASRDGVEIDIGDLEARLGEDVALVALSHVSFKSSYLYDLQRVTELVHRHGALVLWDLSHSVGVVPIDLEAAGVDLAVGCTYKYLNGGPGAPAFLYVRRTLLGELKPPIWGWLGADQPFAFELGFTPAPDVRRFWVSTPPVLSLLSLAPALELVLEAGVTRLRKKSERQTEYLIALAEEWLLPLGFTLGSPRESARRGSHVALRHSDAYRISRALAEPRPGGVCVITDFREPDALRLGVAPLYTTFVEIRRALERLRGVVLEREHERFSNERAAVT